MMPQQMLAALADNVHLGVPFAQFLQGLQAAETTTGAASGDQVTQEGTTHPPAQHVPKTPHGEPLALETLLQGSAQPPLGSAPPLGSETPPGSVPAGSEPRPGSETPPGSEPPTPSPRAHLISSFISSLDSQAASPSEAQAAPAAPAALAACATPSSACENTLESRPMHPCDGASATATGGQQPQRRGRRWRLREMKVAHVLKCLQRLGMSQYASAFERSEIDGYMCDFLDEELLELQLGMASAEHRRRFLAWVDSMQLPQLERFERCI